MLPAIPISSISSNPSEPTRTAASMHALQPKSATTIKMTRYYNPANR